MGNGVSKCLSSGSSAITPKKSMDIEEKQLKVGVVKEENIILKVDCGPRNLQNSYSYMKPKPNWRESVVSVKSDEFSKVRLLMHLRLKMTTNSLIYILYKPLLSFGLNLSKIENMSQINGFEMSDRHTKSHELI